MRTPATKISEYMKPSDSLIEIIGRKHKDYNITKEFAIRAVWSYIKKKKLIDNENPRLVKVDDNLTAFSCLKKIKARDIPEYVERHLTKRRVPYDSEV